MSTLDDLRAQFPSTANMSDAEVIHRVAAATGHAPEDVAGDFGVKLNAPGFVTGLKQGLGSFQYGLSRAVEDATGVQGLYGVRSGQDLQFYNPSSSASSSLEGFKEAPWQGIKEIAGQAVGATLPSLVPFVGHASRATTLGRAVLAARSLPGQTLLAAAPVYGSVRQDQDASGIDDKPRAVIAALGSGAIEAKLGIQGALARRAAARPIQHEVASLSGTPLRTAGKVWARQGVEEGAEEVMQQPLQQWAAHQDPLSDASVRDTGWSGFSGVIGGLALGPFAAISSGRRHATINRKVATDLLNPEASLAGQHEAAQYAREFMSKTDGRDAATDWYNDFMRSQFAARNDYAAQAYPDNAFPLSPAQQADYVQPDMFGERGLAPAEVGVPQEYDGPMAQQDPRQYNLFGYNGAPTPQATLTEDRSVPYVSRVTPQGVFSSVDQTSGVKARDAAKAFEQPSGTYVSDPYNGGQERELTTGELSQFQAGDHQSVMDLWKAQAGVAPVQTIESQPRSQMAQRVEAKIKDAVSRGVIPQDHPAVQDWMASRKTTQDAVSTELAVDDVLSKSAPAQEVTVPSPAALQLAPVQQRVFDHIQQAINSGDTDAVVDAKGVLQYTKIGQALGMARGSAKSAVDSTLGKIARAAGIGVSDLKAKLRERTAAVRTTETADETRLGESPDQQTVVLDEANLYGDNQSMSEVESVGGAQSNIATKSDPATMEYLKENERVPTSLHNKTAQDAAFDEKRKTLAEANRAASIKEALEHPEAQTAALDWDDARSDEAPAFAALTAAHRAAWVSEYVDQVADDAGWAAIERLQRDFEQGILGEYDGGSKGGSDLTRSDTRSGGDTLTNATGEADARESESRVGQARGAAAQETAGEINAPVLLPARREDGRSAGQRDSRTGAQILASHSTEATRDATQRSGAGSVRGSNDGTHSGTTRNSEGEQRRSTVGGASATRNEGQHGGRTKPANGEHSESSNPRNTPDVTSVPLRGADSRGAADGRAPGVSERNPLEARAAQLREVAGEKQSASLDKLVDRYKSGDIDLDRLTAELQQLEEQAFPPERGGKGIQYSESSLRDGLRWKQLVNTPRGVAFKSDRFFLDTAKEIRHGDSDFAANGFFANDLMGHRAFAVEGARTYVMNVFSRPNGVKVGRLVVDIKDGKIVAIHDILAYAKSSGVGTDVVAHIVANTDGPVQIIQMLDKPARDFWSKFGASPDGYDNGQIDWGTSRRYLERKQAAPARDLHEYTAIPRGTRLDSGGSGSAESEGREYSAEEHDAADAWLNEFNAGAQQGQTSSELSASLKQAFPSQQKFDSAVGIVQSVEDLPPGAKGEASEASGRVQAFVDSTGKVWMIAGNITKGREMGVFLHEVGVHLGMEGLLGKQTFDALTRQIDAWAAQSGSQESTIAKQAIESANQSSSQDQQAEKLAYFVEHAVSAGVNPTAMRELSSPLGRWFSTLVNALKAALQKIGMRRFDTLTARDVVDLAYGAANLQLGGVQAKSGAVRFSEAATPAQAQARKIATQLAGRTGAMVSDDVTHAVTKMARNLMSLSDVVDSAKRKLPSATKWYEAVQNTMAERNRLSQAAETLAEQAARLPSSQLDAVNAFIARSTVEQKWGYDPGFNREVVVDPEMARAFAALSENAKTVVRGVFQHGEDMVTKKQEILNALGIDKLFETSGKLKGPYAPLKRFGNYVAVLKSQALLDAERSDDTKREEALKADGKHYVVSFFDTIGQARQFAEANAKDFALADAFEKSQLVGQQGSMPEGILRKIMGALKVNDGVPQQARQAVEQMLQDMYFQTLDEHNARTSGLRRKNREGYDADMLRSFLSHARAEANFLANMKFGGTVNDAFYAMQREAKDSSGRRVGQDEFNILAEHYAKNLEHKETPIQDRVMALTSAWQLATSPAYHITNALQGVMVTVPRLAADFGNYARAWHHMMEGYRTLAHVGLTGELDLNKVRQAGLREALQRAADMGVLDVGMDSDLTQFEATRTGVGAVDKTTAVARRAMFLLRKISRKVEVWNRVSSATAAYNMALENGKSAAEAQDYAVRVLQTTQGDFSRTNAPLILKKLPKVMTQYKKYQFMMGALYVKAAHDAFRGETAEIRAIGRRMLAFKLFHASVGAGVLGLPLMNVVGMVLGAAFGDDDEPFDLERSLRDAIGDDDLANLVLHGPLNMIGLDMSAKLGEDKIFSIAPFSELKLDSSKGVAKTAFDIMAGPSGSQMGRFGNGVGYFEKGDYYRGLENFMPKGFADAMKAFRVANDGYTLNNGDVMFAPDEIGGFATTLNFFGLPTTSLKRMDWLRGQQYELTQFYTDRSREIQRDYKRAAAEGDTEAMSELRQAWMDLQDGKDRVRGVFNGSHDALRRQPLSTLLRYPQTSNAREKKIQLASPEL